MNTPQHLRLLCVVSASVLLGPGLAGQAATAPAAAVVSVVVRSADTGTLLERARVELMPGGREAMTDQVGLAEFGGLAPAATPCAWPTKGFRRRMFQYR